MLPPSIIPLKRRVHRKRRRVVSARPMGNRILNVRHGGTHGDDAIVVTVQGTVTSLEDFSQALLVMMGGSGYLPIGGNFDQLPEVLLLFGMDVTASTTWSVPSVDVWHFEDGQPLQAPLSGEIE
jgi:hypothetical protein